MNEYDQRIERNLRVIVERHGSQYEAHFDIPGVSISGFGHNDDEAVRSLLLRLINTATSHMDKAQTQLHGVTPDLDVNIGWHWDKQGQLWVTITDATGRRCVMKGPGSIIPGARSKDD